MKIVPIQDNLYMKPLNPEDPKDIWLAKELDKDELVCGPTGYLYSIQNKLRLLRSYSTNLRDTLYDNSYSIYLGQNPIGYFHISDKCIDTGRLQESFVSLAYALLRRERGKGYMKKVLCTVSDELLLEITRCELLIEKSNQASAHLAKSTGYQLQIPSSLEDFFEEDFDIYEKVKK